VQGIHVLGRMSALVTRRPVAALAAALGAGAAMLLASPAVPASAAGLSASPAAAAAQTVSVTAHPTTSGAISPFSNPLDITCTFTIDPPSIGQGVLSAGAHVTCTYDRDGTPANVQFIDLDDYLLFNGTFKDHRESTPSDNSFANTFVFAACQHGTWSNTVSLGVTFPAGYSPQVASATDTANATIARCPGDPPICAITCPGSAGGTEPAVRAREPEPQPDARPQAMASEPGGQPMN
jgi:hypothetical protein